MYYWTCYFLSVTFLLLPFFRYSFSCYFLSVTLFPVTFCPTITWTKDKFGKSYLSRSTAGELECLTFQRQPWAVCEALSTSTVHLFQLMSYLPSPPGTDKFRYHVIMVNCGLVRMYLSMTTMTRLAAHSCQRQLLTVSRLCLSPLTVGRLGSHNVNLWWVRMSYLPGPIMDRLGCHKSSLEGLQRLTFQR